MDKTLDQKNLLSKSKLFSQKNKNRLFPVSYGKQHLYYNSWQSGFQDSKLVGSLHWDTLFVDVRIKYPYIDSCFGHLIMYEKSESISLLNMLFHIIL